MASPQPEPMKTAVYIEDRASAKAGWKTYGDPSRRFDLSLPREWKVFDGIDNAVDAHSARFDCSIFAYSQGEGTHTDLKKSTRELREWVKSSRPGPSEVQMFLREIGTVEVDGITFNYTVYGPKKRSGWVTIDFRGSDGRSSFFVSSARVPSFERKLRNEYLEIVRTIRRIPR